jgi:hypothetical protein
MEDRWSGFQFDSWDLECPTDKEMTYCSSDELVEGGLLIRVRIKLDALHPPPFVRSLKICGYSGSTYPSWLSGEQRTLENLQNLESSFCKGSDGPRKFSQFLVNLQIIKILNCSWRP